MTFTEKKSITFRWTQMQFIWAMNMLKHFRPVLELKSKTHNLVNLILKYSASLSDGLYLLFHAREDKSIFMHCVTTYIFS